MLSASVENGPRCTHRCPPGRTRCLRHPRPGQGEYASGERPGAPWTHAPRSPCRRTRLPGYGCGRRTGRPARRSRRQLLLERAAGRKRHEVGDPCPLHHVDIGAVVDVGWREPVSLVVARHEHDWQALDLADAQGGRRLAQGSRCASRARSRAREDRKARTADDAKHCLCHVIPLTRRPAYRTPHRPSGLVHPRRASRLRPAY